MLLTLLLEIQVNLSLKNRLPIHPVQIQLQDLRAHLERMVVLVPPHLRAITAVPTQTRIQAQRGTSNFSTSSKNVVTVNFSCIVVSQSQLLLVLLLVLWS